MIKSEIAKWPGGPQRPLWWMTERYIYLRLCLWVPDVTLELAALQCKKSEDQFHREGEMGFALARLAIVSNTSLSQLDRTVCTTDLVLKVYYYSFHVCWCREQPVWILRSGSMRTSWLSDFRRCSSWNVWLGTSEVQIEHTISDRLSHL